MEVPPLKLKTRKRNQLRRNMARTRPNWAMIWGGGCKTYGGRKTYQRTRPPEKFWTPPKELLVCSVQKFVQEKTERRHPRGVENVLYERGPKPLFGRGGIREVFLPPLFSTPPWRPLTQHLPRLFAQIH